VVYSHSLFSPVGVKMRDLRLVGLFIASIKCCLLIVWVLFQLDVVLETNKSAIRVLEAVQKQLSQ